MGYITPFNMLMIITLLSMQIATSNGTLFCFTGSYQSCYVNFIQRSLQQECVVDQTIQCLKRLAEECDINDSTEPNAMKLILGMEKVLTDMCQAGSEMNAGLLKHAGCIFGTKLGRLYERCYEDVKKDLSKYKFTGNAEKDQKALYKIACGYADEIKNCVSDFVGEECGEDAQIFQRKMSDPTNKLEIFACNNSPATFGQFWTFLLQATAILMSAQYFRITK